jgi:hypothetical protein
MYLDALYKSKVPKNHNKYIVINAHPPKRDKKKKGIRGCKHG